MEKIPIRDEDIVSLDDPAYGIKGLRTLFVNLFLVAGRPNEWTLVDAGLAVSSSKIRSWIREREEHGGTLVAAVLTHGHFDHVGAIKDIADEWRIPVYAHPLELPYLTGQAKYPPPDASVGGGLMAVLSPLYPRTGVDLGESVMPLRADGTVPSLPGWQWVHTPGHTEGHISLIRESDRFLIAGDAVCTTKQESFLAVATQKAELHGPPAYYTTDWDAARKSVNVLARLKPSGIAAGHGVPMAGSHVSTALGELAHHFDEVARPSRGRYV